MGGFTSRRIDVSHRQQRKLKEETDLAIVQSFVEALQKNRRRLFHFTDSRNIESIRAHGLLPTSLLTAQGIEVVTGGDEDSLGIDRYKGLDQFIRLSFCRSHPMAHVAKQRGNIEQIRILTICPTVLLREGVQLANKVATANDAEICAAAGMIAKMDFEATYQRINWSVPENQARRNAAEKWEALIPGAITISDIIGL